MRYLFFSPKTRNHKSSWRNVSHTFSPLFSLCLSFFLLPHSFAHTHTARTSTLRAPQKYTHHPHGQQHENSQEEQEENIKDDEEEFFARVPRALRDGRLRAPPALLPRVGVLGVAPVRLGVAPVLRPRRCALFIVNTDTKINLSVTIIKTNDEGGWRGGYWGGGYW